MQALVVTFGFDGPIGAEHAGLREQLAAAFAAVPGADLEGMASPQPRSGRSDEGEEDGVRRRLVGAAVACATVVVASAAFAAASPHAVTIGGRGFRTNVTVTFAAPASYALKTALRYGGAWKGPRWKSSSGDEADSLLDFSSHSDFTTRSPAIAAKNFLGNDTWATVASGPIDVPHVIRGRKVGVIRGFMLIRHSPAQGYEGWYKAVVGFALGRGYPVMVTDVKSDTPGDDSNGLIEGQLPSVWNRKAIDQALAGIVVNGNLAAEKITAAVQGRRIAGRVTDTVGHPVVGVKVTVRGRGAACCSATTTATGAYSINVPASAGTGAFAVSVAGPGGALTKRVSVH